MFISILFIFQPTYINSTNIQIIKNYNINNFASSLGLILIWKLRVDVVLEPKKVFVLNEARTHDPGHRLPLFRVECDTAQLSRFFEVVGRYLVST